MEENKVVIGKKVFYKKSLFGHISNGGGIISLGNSKAIKFVALSEEFVELYLLEYGLLDGKIKTQSWQKSKKVIEKKTIIKEIKVKPKKEQRTLNVQEEIKSSNIFDLEE